MVAASKGTSCERATVSIDDKKYTRNDRGRLVSTKIYKGLQSWCMYKTSIQAIERRLDGSRRTRTRSREYAAPFERSWSGKRRLDDAGTE